MQRQQIGSQPAVVGRLNVSLPSWATERLVELQARMERERNAPVARGQVIGEALGAMIDRMDLELHHRQIAEEDAERAAHAEQRLQAIESAQAMNDDDDLFGGP